MRPFAMITHVGDSCTGLCFVVTAVKMIRGKDPLFVVMLRRKVCSKLFSVSNGAEWIVKSPLLGMIAIVLGDRTHVVAENCDK